MQFYSSRGSTRVQGALEIRSPPWKYFISADVSEMRPITVYFPTAATPSQWRSTARCLDLQALLIHDVVMDPLKHRDNHNSAIIRGIGPHFLDRTPRPSEACQGLRSIGSQNQNLSLNLDSNLSLCIRDHHFLFHEWRYAAHSST